MCNKSDHLLRDNCNKLYAIGICLSAKENSHETFHKVSFVPEFSEHKDLLKAMSTVV